VTRRLAWALLALAPLAAPGASPSGRDEELERWLRALDSAREPEWTSALEHLSALGEPAAARALEGFEELGHAARRARARLLAATPPIAGCARLLALARDPDPEVRRLVAEAAGNPALAENAAAERVETLARLLFEDPDPGVRARALDGLVESALPAAVPVLEAALARLAPDEAELAALALGQMPEARELLVARVVAACAGEAPTPDGVLAALLRSYGRALAEVPRGGEGLRERLPFLCAVRHPAPEVQAASRAALASFLARAAELSESARAERVLARLAEEGWPPVGCLVRRLELAWHELGDPARALELARELERATLALEPDEHAVWSVRARFYTAAARYALGESAAAREAFAALASELEAARRARSDLFPAPRAEAWSQGGGRVQMERQSLAAVARTWLALIALETSAGGDDGGNEVERGALRELRGAHQLFLEARLVAQRTDAPDPSSLDALLLHELGPLALVLFNEELAPERRARSLDLALAFSAAFGRVAPLELPGFGSDAPAPELGDVFADPARLALLKGMRAAQLRGLERRQRELTDALLGPSDADERASEASLLRQYRMHLLRLAQAEDKAASELAGQVPTSAELRRAYAQLLDYLAPSLHAHTLAGELRAEGRTREARELCERALSVLATAPLGSPFWSEYSSARLEMLRGSTLMDDGRAAEAERAYESAVQRLLAIESQAKERAAADGASSAAYEGQLRAARELRGDALLSLAVNANVRMGDPARALGYFERAYELNQNAFMRVLRACYRARSGKHDEARTVLRGVVPTPSLYYNIACTHALLGDAELALDYLERDLAANHPTAGARAQKLEWTSKDPDLASLRDQPRFRRLLEGR
jgi:hypothetical protein